MLPPLLGVCGFLSSVQPAGGQIVDMKAAFEKIPAQASALTFDRGGFNFPRGGHLQGIQIRYDAADDRYFVFLSHDSATVAYLAVVEFPGNLSGPGRLVHVHTFPGDGRSPPLRHAGGIQLAGDVLAVGLEDNQQKTRSEIQFWNVAQPARPQQLEHLTIRRRGAPKDKTAGAVGIVKRQRDYLVAVGNWDSRAIDFYVSDGRPLDDRQCRFGFLVRWRDAAAEKDAWQPDQLFASYQAIHLAADAKGKLFLIAPHTTGGQNAVDLFALDLDAASSRLLSKRQTKPLRLPAGNSFRAAGGAWFGPEEINVLSSPRNIGATSRLGVVR